MPQTQEATGRENLFSGYDLGVYYDEMFGSPGQPRPHYEEIFAALATLTAGEFEERRRLADLSFLLQGITFTVYSDGRGTERLFPFDLIPRVIPRSQWDRLEAGLCQRVMALNLFLQDVYGPQRILKDGKIPRALVFSCQHYQRQMSGVQVPRGIYTHIFREIGGLGLESGCPTRVVCWTLFGPYAAALCGPPRTGSSW